jgi:hypothetical protein
MNVIPEMTHPYGKHWDQPKDIRDVDMDDTHVLLNRRQFDGLHEYSASLPTGVYEGKCWRREDAEGGDLLCWYDASPEGRPDLCTISFRRILII